MSEYPKGWQVVGENGPELIALQNSINNMRANMMLARQGYLKEHETPSQ